MKKKVLLVDNVKSILEREKSLLSRENFQIFTATSGEEAIEVHRAEHVDAIVMDLHMPKFPGDQVCRIIRADPDLKKVSILLATLLDDETELERCRDSGANGCIKKPVNKDELAEKLAGLLGIPLRQAIRILVKIKLDAVSGGGFFIANTVDVSVTGLLFECEHELKVGDFVESSFFLPVSAGFKRVVSNAEVMRVAAGDGKYKAYGVRFRDFKEGGPELIAEFVAKKTGKA